MPLNCCSHQNISSWSSAGALIRPRLTMVILTYVLLRNIPCLRISFLQDAVSDTSSHVPAWAIWTSSSLLGKPPVQTHVCTVNQVATRTIVEVFLKCLCWVISGCCCESASLACCWLSFLSLYFCSNLLNSWALVSFKSNCSKVTLNIPSSCLVLLTSVLEHSPKFCCPSPAIALYQGSSLRAQKPYL